MEVDIKDSKKLDFSNLVDLIKFDTFYGRGGSFLITPLHQSKVFSKEMFSEDQKMFANAALEYAETRLKPVKDEFKTLNKDLTLELFKEIGEMGFLGVDMPEEYGGSDLDKTTAALVVDYLAFSECGSLLVTLGAHSGIGTLPIVWYGTKEQKEYYLPRFAEGKEIGCFGLTSLHAGSDAASIPDTGVICRGHYNNEEVLGIRLNFSKRYITLAPVATMIGLAFQLYDPEYLIGDKDHVGITVALVPSKHPGVQSGRRHSPLTLGFMNGPLYGKDVFIPLDWVVGGAKNCGKGWSMLMGCLSVGRGISMPALASAVAQQCGRMTGAYAKIRRQFKRSVGEFEGIKEPLAHIAGWGFMMEANRYCIANAVNAGDRPSVAAAISKYHLTELSRRLLQMAMDVHSGHALQAGPQNLFAEVYNGLPVSTVGEGANIMTRNLIIFGQGVMRAHPYLRDEIMAGVNEDDSAKALSGFDKYFFKHMGFALSAWVKGLGYSLGLWRLIRIPEKTYLQREVQKVTRLSNALIAITDIALLVLGKKLKMKESLSARLGDVLSHLLMATAVVKYYQDHRKVEGAKNAAKWAIDYCLYQCSQALKLFFDNFPNRFLAFLLKAWFFTFTIPGRYPSDKLSYYLADEMQSPSELRELLTANCFVGTHSKDPIGRIERAWQLLLSCEHLTAKISAAILSGKLKRELTREATIEQALELNLITQTECEQLLHAELARNEAMVVDEFAFNELVGFNADSFAQIKVD